MSQGDPRADDLVVRGGTLTTREGLDAAQNNAKAVEAAYGRPGLCVASAPGMTLMEAIRGRPVRNTQLIQSRVMRLLADGFEVTAEPGAAKRVAAILWLPNREFRTLKRLAESFDPPIDHPMTRQERIRL